MQRTLALTNAVSGGRVSLDCPTSGRTHTDLAPALGRHVHHLRPPLSAPTRDRDQRITCRAVSQNLRTDVTKAGALQIQANQGSMSVVIK